MRQLKVAWDETFARRNLTGTRVYAENLLKHLAARPELQIEVFEGWGTARRAGSTAARAGQGIGNLAWLHTRLPALCAAAGSICCMRPRSWRRWAHRAQP